jgi:hypothetical protein
MPMATLRDCYFAYYHEVTGADMNAEVRLIKVKRTDIDFETQVCEACAQGLLASGQFVLVAEEPHHDEPNVTEIPAVSLQDLLEEGVEANAEGNEEGDGGN